MVASVGTGERFNSTAKGLDRAVSTRLPLLLLLTPLTSEGRRECVWVEVEKPREDTEEEASDTDERVGEGSTLSEGAGEGKENSKNCDEA
jgi:hypothetical protein